MDELKPGAIVVVEGCHQNYRPKLISIDGDVATVETVGLGIDGRKQWPVERLRPAPPLKKGRRRP